MCDKAELWCLNHRAQRLPSSQAGLYRYVGCLPLLPPWLSLQQQDPYCSKGKTIALGDDFSYVVTQTTPLPLFPTFSPKSPSHLGSVHPIEAVLRFYPSFFRWKGKITDRVKSLNVKRLLQLIHVAHMRTFAVVPQRELISITSFVPTLCVCLRLTVSRTAAESSFGLLASWTAGSAP